MENTHPQTNPIPDVIAGLPEQHELISTIPSTENLERLNATIIPITVQQQEQTNWCWIACSVSIHNFYSPGSAVTQCQTASFLLNLTCCVGPIIPAGCNVPGLPSTCLQALRNLNKVKTINSLTFPEIQTEIRAQRPLIVGYTNPGNQSGHAIVLCGFDNAGYVYIIDPTTGTAVVKFADFIFYYSKYFSEVSFTQR
ncbi:C39 family peptidase [Chitinophaga nivalis]|uniref:C39 family peptidase n=1 Tax=Chitinophaga nivalis TaxID=2991709 RepID=A0ABT3IM15_9BACT|nr:papain-like cysteine protease family protein [Chitinophaga nivalis]MCW3465302.1 C39 family peptidase [Chitinophaga nivalis]MCW3485006.1 C39 family peptidase [Chitinophaga nivalis]